MRRIEVIVVSCLARVEVLGAIRRKRRMGDLSEADARLLAAEFESDYFGNAEQAARFVVTGIVPRLLDAAAAFVITYDLRAYDAIQLASACAVREIDRACATFACSDRTLRSAALAEGFRVVP